MVRAFDKMASLSDLSRADVEEFFLQLADLALEKSGRSSATCWADLIARMRRPWSPCCGIFIRNARCT